MRLSVGPKSRGKSNASAAESSILLSKKGGLVDMNSEKSSGKYIELAPLVSRRVSDEAIPRLDGFDPSRNSQSQNTNDFLYTISLSLFTSVFTFSFRLGFSLLLTLAVISDIFFPTPTSHICNSFSAVLYP